MRTDIKSIRMKKAKLIVDRFFTDQYFRYREEVLNTPLTIWRQLY